MNRTTLWRRGATLLGALALVASAGTASAQRTDVRQDRREVQRDRMDFRSDQRDVARLQNLIARLNQAQARFDRPAEARFRSQIHGMLRQEIAEARRDLRRDQREEYRSARDAGSGRGDVRDDRRDRIESRRRLDRLNGIQQRLRQVEPAVRAHDRRAMREEDRLLASFLSVARQDAVQSGRELNEDRRELRQDRAF